MCAIGRAQSGTWAPMKRRPRDAGPSSKPLAAAAEGDELRRQRGTVDRSTFAQTHPGAGRMCRAQWCSRQAGNRFTAARRCRAADRSNDHLTLPPGGRSDANAPRTVFRAIPSRRDLPDRHAHRPMQPADLSPILRFQHPLQDSCEPGVGQDWRNPHRAGLTEAATGSRRRGVKSLCSGSVAHGILVRRTVLCRPHGGFA